MAPSNPGVIGKFFGVYNLSPLQCLTNDPMIPTLHPQFWKFGPLLAPFAKITVCQNFPLLCHRKQDHRENKRTILRENHLIGSLLNLWVKMHNMTMAYLVV